MARTGERSVRSSRCCVDAAGAGHVRGDRLFAARHRQRVQRRLPRGEAEAVRGSRRRRQFGAGADPAHVRRRRSRSAPPPSLPSTCRRSSACRPAAASNISSRRSRARTRRASAASCKGIVAAANQDPRLARVFSTFTATTPSIYLDIDRDKAQALGLNINDVFTALQATLGGFYVNDFNLYGRTWQVNIEGEAANRRDISDIWQIIRAQQDRRNGADAFDRRPAARRRPAGDHALQQLSLRSRSTAARARRLVGRRARRDGGGVGKEPCRPATPSNGPARPIRSTRRAGRPARYSPSRWCSPSCSWSGFTRAG